MQSGQCAIQELAKQVKWPSAKKSGYTKMAPTGDLIENIFSDWKKGKLKDGIEKAINMDPPALDKICQAIVGDKCPFFSRCENWTRRPDILSDLPGMFETGETWHILGRPLKRSILLLVILGKSGVRQGGYLRSDLRKIAGTKSTSTDRVLDRLRQLHVLRRTKKRGKAPRFRYDLEFDLAKIDDKSMDGFWQFWQETNDEYIRRYAVKLVDRLDRLVPRRKKGVFCEGKEYANLPSGLVIGYQPPKWYVDILGEYTWLLSQSSTIPLVGPGAKAAPREHWLGGEDEFYLLFERTASRLIKKIRSIPRSERWWWNSPFDLGDDDTLVVLELPGRFNEGITLKEREGLAKLGNQR